MTARLAFKLRMPAEMQQLASQMLDMEGFCICGRLIARLEGKFLLSAVMPSVGFTTLAAYCQPCAQILNRCLLGLKKASYIDGTESMDPQYIPRNERPAS